MASVLATRLSRVLVLQFVSGSTVSIDTGRAEK